MDLVRRTFFTPPIPGKAAHGLAASECRGGVCEREARVAQRGAGARPSPGVAG